MFGGIKKQNKTKTPNQGGEGVFRRGELHGKPTMPTLGVATSCPGPRCGTGLSSPLPASTKGNYFFFPLDSQKLKSKVLIYVLVCCRAGGGFSPRLGELAGCRGTPRGCHAGGRWAQCCRGPMATPRGKSLTFWVQVHPHRASFCTL